MIPIGEKLNSSIPSTNKAFAARDAAYVTRQTRAQLAAGAVYLDLNAAVFFA